MKRIYHGWWVLTAVTFAGLMAYGPGVYAFTLFVKPLAAEFDWGRAMLGGSVAAFWMSAPLIPLVGMWTDRYGGRPMLLIGAIIEGLAFIAISRIDSALQLYLLRIAMGAGKICIAVPIPILVAKWFDRRRGLAIGIAFAGWHLGGVVVVPPAQYLLDAFGWRTAAVILGGSIVALVVPIVLLGVRDKSASDVEPGADITPDAIEVARDSEVSHGFTFQEAARTPLYWMIAAITVIYYTAYATVIVHQAAFLTDIGFDPQRAANLISMTAGLSIVGVIGFGAAADRWHYKNLLTAVFCLLATGLVILVSLTSTQNALWAYAFIVPFGLAVGAGDVIWVTMLRSCFGERSFGTIFGVWYFFMLSTLAIAPIVVGYVYDGTQSYESSFELILVLLCAALAVTVLSKLEPGPPAVAQGSEPGPVR